jgi:hypothetical protein
VRKLYELYFAWSKAQKIISKGQIRSEYVWAITYVFLPSFGAGLTLAWAKLEN